MSTTIVADLSQNPFKSYEKSAALIDSAKRAGANAVMFGCYRAENIAAPGTTIYNTAKQNEIDYMTLSALVDYCGAQNMGVIAAPHDTDSIAFLYSKGVAVWSVTADNLNNVPLLILMGQTGRPVMVDCAHHENEVIKRCVTILKEFGTTEIYLVHSSLHRPTPIENVNLRGMIALKGNFQTRVGFADTSDNTIMCAAAATYMADVIVKGLAEKPAADRVNEAEFAKMVKTVRSIEAGLGDGNRTPTDAHIALNRLTKKCIVAAKDIAEGESFNETNMAIMHAAEGMDPLYWYDLCEQQAKKPYKKGDPIYYSES